MKAWSAAWGRLLRALHGRCLRSMCRVTRAHTWRLRITSDELMCRRRARHG